METFSALLAICAGNSPVTGEFPHKGQWRGPLMFSLICSWINGWVNTGEAGDLRRHRAHYDVIVMQITQCISSCITDNFVKFMPRLYESEDFLKGLIISQSPGDAYIYIYIYIYASSNRVSIGSGNGLVPNRPAISQRVPKLLYCIMSFKITLLEFLPHLPGASDLIIPNYEYRDAMRPQCKTDGPLFAMSSCTHFPKCPIYAPINGVSIESSVFGFKPLSKPMLGYGQSDP